jgi:hypothetical protein
MGRIDAPVKPRMRREDQRIFTKRRTEKRIKKRIIAVPKSGCFRMRPMGMTRKRKGIERSFKVKPSRSGGLWKNLAKAMMREIFTNSEGWKEREPIRIHRCAPEVIMPKAMTTTRKNKVPA